jgi:hypothetical protein
MAAEACAREVNEGGKFGDPNDRKRFKRRYLTALTLPPPCHSGADQARHRHLAGRPHRHAYASDKLKVNEGQNPFTASDRQVVRGHED